MKVIQTTLSEAEHKLLEEYAKKFQDHQRGCSRSNQSNNRRQRKPKRPLNVQIATRTTYNFSTEVYICKNPDYRPVDTRLLNKMLKEIGLDEAVIEKVEANVVAW